jgi:tRNA U34 5-carboxymethylaminomethyl modifying GTPase MnmE/TrmE
MNIPKTLVIGINMHGELHLTESGSLLKDVVPDNFRVTVINAVAPGVPNISTLEKYEEMAEKVNNRIKRRKNWNELTKAQLDKLSESIKGLLVKTNKQQSKDIIKEHQRLYSKNQVNKSFQKFANHYDHSFKITSYNSGDKMPDKLYLKFEEGEVINPDDIVEEIFSTMIRV